MSVEDSEDRPLVIAKLLDLGIAHFQDENTRLRILLRAVTTLDPLVRKYFPQWVVQDEAMILEIMRKIRDNRDDLRDAEAIEVADRVLILVEGRAVAEESIGQLRERLKCASPLRVYVERPGPAHIAAALEAGALEAELNCNALLVTAPQEQRFEILVRLARVSPLHRFETEKPVLEDIYLRYVQASRDQEIPDATL